MDPRMFRLFKLEHSFDEYRDYVLNANYKSAGSAIRVTLTHNVETDAWYLIMEQEEGWGNFQEVLSYSVTPERAAEILNW